MHTYFPVYQPAPGSPTYNRIVILGSNRPALVFGGIAMLFAAVALFVLRLFPQPHHPIQYVLAGTCATAAVLLAGFVVLGRKRS